MASTYFITDDIVYCFAVCKFCTVKNTLKKNQRSPERSFLIISCEYCSPRVEAFYEFPGVKDEGNASICLCNCCLFV